MRPALTNKAIRLGRMVVALIELQASSVAARINASCNPVFLLEQERSRWDRLLIRRGLACRCNAQTQPIGLQNLVHPGDRWVAVLAQGEKQCFVTHVSAAGHFGHAMRLGHMPQRHQQRGGIIQIQGVLDIGGVFGRVFQGPGQGIVIALVTRCRHGRPFCFQSLLAGLPVGLPCPDRPPFLKSTLQSASDELETDQAAARCNAARRSHWVCDPSAAPPRRRLDQAST